MSEAARDRAAAAAAQIEAAISQALPCRCGHPIDHHDAGECWTTADGNETWDETACPCSGYEPKESA